MSSELDPEADLFEEIRAAVAETASPGIRPDTSAADHEALETMRLPLRRAEEHLTPSVPAGARLARVKRSALRGLRFLWRDQASFNRLTLDSVKALLGEVEEQRNSVEGLEKALRSDRAGMERWKAQVAASTTEKIAAWERRAAIQDHRFALLETTAPKSGASAALEGSPARSLPPAVYSLFEERFRGSPGEIEEKQRFYLRFLRELPGPVFDVGCGRGEFLRLLGQEGIPASGVEINPISVEECRRAGLDVEQAEGVGALSRKPAASLGAVVAFQVVEHWAAETTFVFLSEARRSLSPGGVLIAETINTDSLSALRAFFLDPSHIRPVPSEALRFLAEAAGFVRSEIEYRAPLPAEERLVETSENEARLNRLLFGPQDYALIARVP